MGENDNESQETPPATLPATPPATSPPATPPVETVKLSERLDRLESSLTSLPETIANAVKEATTPPKAPRAPRQPAVETKTEPVVEEQTPGAKSYKSFGHRWFGISS